MKYVIIIFLVQLTVSDCLCQKKKKNETKEIKTDTLLVLQRFDDSLYKEVRTFWSDTNEVGINHTQFYDLRPNSDAGYSFELSLIFFNWDSVVIDKDYNLADRKDIKVECIRKGWGAGKFDLSKGSIRVISKSKDKLTFSFDLGVVSTDKTMYLIYKGERDFKRDY